MKVCRECNNPFPLEMFYVHSKMADGHLNKCKECVKTRVKIHRRKNVDRIREYDRDRANEPARLAAKTSYIRQYRKDNPEKWKAHCALNNAVRDGKITKQPCEVCGDPKVEGHHEDYSKPLEVNWLCCIHHNEIHHYENRQI